ncbi:hypothetical protein F441_08061 [Phytophthora nicotianae CJ01A1]|uniref:ZSWIM1/3 RNaseH-like domain-containing protein n=1 Tax=Phytophthora nicotianae CJ01A1 TaxID=1317063 RepID=W2X594_PHYNI|nr:hypothetical protein F441_08061 [Phytophthora nicotianae CJ01A1]
MKGPYDHVPEISPNAFRGTLVPFGALMDAIKTLVALACVNAQVGMEVAQLVSRLRSFKLPRKVAQLTIGSTYQGSACVDNRPDVQSRLADMVSVGGAPKKITQFLSDSLERMVTPQQARNIIQRVLGKSSVEHKPKHLLDAVAEQGSSVLLLQDQLDVTTAIFIQTAVQKRIFREWGDCLLMDWTHSTNNLGYRLGSFLVTCPTGRGITILDFVSLNQKAITMEHILGFFKAKNNGWEQIKSVVIDKDFAEWRALDHCFPQAKVLLCQFTRSPTGKSYYDRERLLSLFMQMLKSLLIDSYSKTAFEESYQSFTDFCESDSPEVLVYFDKNWKTCVNMWASFSRGRYFSAGNTTTNRVEANWNQLKMLLGYRPGLDKTVAGILCHQVAVLHQFTSDLSRYATKSRPVGAVPVFLRRLASVLSEYAYQRVRREWDLLNTVMKSARCTKSDQERKSGMFIRTLMYTFVTISSGHAYVFSIPVLNCHANISSSSPVMDFNWQKFLNLQYFSDGV